VTVTGNLRDLDRDSGFKPGDRLQAAATVTEPRSASARIDSPRVATEPETTDRDGRRRTATRAGGGYRDRDRDSPASR
jgi:acyl dehydratase